MSESWNVDDFLAEYRPPEQVVHITMRGDLLGRLNKLEEQLRAAQDDTSSSLDSTSAFEIATLISDLQNEVRASMREFRMVAMGDAKWSDLTAKYPPPKDKPELPFDPDKFWPAAIAASAADPPMTEAQATKLLEALSSGQTRKLIDAVFTANGGDDDLPKSVSGSVIRQHSEQKRTIAVPAGSHDLFSSAE